MSLAERFADLKITPHARSRLVERTWCKSENEIPEYIEIFLRKGRDGVTHHDKHTRRVAKELAAKRCGVQIIVYKNAAHLIVRNRLITVLRMHWYLRQNEAWLRASKRRFKRKMERKRMRRAEGGEQ